MEAAVDLAPHVRPMMAQHRSTIAMLRTQLEILPDVAAELEAVSYTHLTLPTKA